MRICNFGEMVKNGAKNFFVKFNDFIIMIELTLSKQNYHKIPPIHYDYLFQLLFSTRSCLVLYFFWTSKYLWDDKS